MADPCKRSPSPSQTVCRRNPNPGLPTASRRSGRAGHHPLPWGGTHGKGHGVSPALCESGRPLGYPTRVSSHLCCLLKGRTFQFQPPLTQTPPGVHASCRLLSAAMMPTQRDVRVCGSCFPGRLPAATAPLSPEYQVSHNTASGDCHHPTRHVTTRQHARGILCRLQKLTHKESLVREGGEARMQMGGFGPRSYAFCCYPTRKGYKTTHKS